MARSRHRGKGAAVGRRWRFGAFELAVDERRLLADGRPVPLGGRAFDLLCVLAEHADRVVSKDELFARVWPGLVVEDNNLTVQVSALRRVLGTGAIANLPGRGYRLVLAVQLASDDALPVAMAAAVAPAAAPPAASPVAALPGFDERVRLAAVPTSVWLALPPQADAGAMLALSGCAQLHGGQPVATPVGAGSRLCGFTNLRAALDCAAALHTRPPGGWRLAVLPADTVDAATAVALAASAAPGTTLLSESVAASVIPQVDGELGETGSHDRAPHGLASRCFLLTPPMSLSPAPLQSVPVERLKPVVAVLPFSLHGAAAGALPLGDILTDQLIGALSRGDTLHVISRLSTSVFRDTVLPLRTIAASLGAHYVVSGRLWASAGRLQVQVELADAHTGQVLWAEALGDHEDAVLRMDSQLVQTVMAGVLRALFTDALRAVRGQPLPDLASHALLLAAVHLLYRTSPRDFGLARDALQTLRSRAPTHAAPLAWLARWHLTRVVLRWSDDPAADGRAALDLAQQALDLDPDSALAMTMLGNVHTSHLRDLQRAEWLYDQALAANPNESLAWLAKGNALAFRGEGSEALRHTQHALSLSPLDPSRHFYLGIQASAALTAGDLDRAVEAARATIRLNFQHLSAHRVLAIALSLLGRRHEAQAAGRGLLTLDPTINVQDWLRESPGASTAVAQRYAQALLDAGVPAARAG